MRTQGEIEAVVCERVVHFEQQYVGRGPDRVHAHLIGDLLVVRLRGVLTAAEQRLAESAPPEKGKALVKQVRAQLVESARAQLGEMVREATGVGVRSMHYDICTAHGEEALLFSLTEAPAVRNGKHGSAHGRAPANG